MTGHKGAAMQRCLGCMEEYEEKYDICPYCGYERGTQPREAYHMPPGTMLAERYRIGRVLGFGGFGVTYLGWDEVLLRKVAIKEYLPGEFSTRIPGQTVITTYEGERSEQFNGGLGKFLEEAKILAKLESANGVVRIYNSFQENNTAYIVMEYLEGRTLKEYLEQRGKLSEKEAKEILHPVIVALKEVHEMGILHRDIAPDNIFLTNDGKVKLLDFGASRFATTSHSKSLSVIIKPGYAPVEQYRSRGDQGPWTDVYSLAAVFYKMVTGITPEDAMERVEKEELKKPSKLGADISRNTEHAIMNALNIKIEDRTQSAKILEQELYGEEKVKLRFVHLKKADVGKWPLGIKLAACAASLVVVLFAGLLATGVIDYSRLIPEGFALPAGMTRVPNLVNEEVEAANAVMTEAGLILQIVDKQYSENIPMGMVLSQNVNRGKIVKLENVVEIVVSGGREPVVIPDLRGYQKEEALKVLAAAGLMMEILEEYGAFEEGAVMAQSLEAGVQAYRGDTVVLTVSLGLDTFLDEEREIIIPDFTGMSMGEATKKASEMGLYLTKAGEKESTASPGTILTQSPSAGTAGRQGDVILLTTAAEQSTVYVPDVQYREAAAALADLEALGFQVSIGYEESSIVAKDRVIRQSLAANLPVKKGSEIVLTVSLGTEKLNQSGAPEPNNTPDSGSAEKPAETSKPGSTEKPAETPPPQWSEWMAELPAGVDKSGYEIEKKSQYSFRDKSVTTSKKQEMPGWTLYDTTTAQGEYGQWSAWSTNKPTEQTGREIEEKTQYSYTDYETKKSDKASESGWTLKDTRTYYLEDYGNWSDWSTDAAAAGDTRKTETREQYRIRTRKKEYKEANSLTLDGYTRDRGVREAEGAWSDWSENQVSASDTDTYRIEVETRKEQRNVIHYKTKYYYYHWRVPRGDGTGRNDYWTAQVANSQLYELYLDAPLTDLKASNVGGTGKNAYANGYEYRDNNGVWCYRHWYADGTRDVPETVTEEYDVYRSRKIDYFYSFWKWGDWSGWSDWSDNRTEGNESTEVEARTLYRYADKIPHYEYTYERWTEDSAWSDTPYPESATRKVKTQTIYKYRDRTDTVTYHFYLWGAWSDWRDEKVDGSDTREVQQRTVYRYRQK